MTLSLYVLTPNRNNWDSEVKEIILSTNSGQIGMLRNRAPIATVVDIGLLRIRLNDQWLPVALMGGFARISNNEITILGNDAEMNTDTDPQEAQQALEIAKANLSRAQGKRQAIEANLALRSRRILYMEIRGQGTIPLTRTNENLTPREIEQKAAKLAYSLYVPIEVL